MAFVFSAFLGGAAKTALDIIEQQEKDARTNAAIQAKALYENYAENRKSNQKLRSELVDNVRKLDAAIPADAFASAQDRQNAFYELATNPGAMKKLNQIIDDRAFDPKNIAWKDLVKLQGDPSDQTALDRVIKATTFPTTLPESGLKPFRSLQAPNEVIPGAPDGAITPSKATTAGRAMKAGAKVSSGGGLFGAFGEAEAERTMKEAALSIGLTPEALRAGAEYTRPELASTAQIDMSVFTPPETFTVKKDKAQTQMTEALASGDQKRIDDASRTIARLAMVDSVFTPKPKETEADAEKLLRDKIIDARNKGDKSLEAKLTNELRLRQRLSKLPDDDKKKDELTAANLLAVAKGAVNNTVAARMPAGSLALNANGDLVPTSLASDATHKAAVRIGQETAVSYFVNKDGVVTDPKAVAALASIGISVDPQTKKPIIPEIPVTPVQTPQVGTGREGRPAPRPTPAAAPAVPQAEKPMPTGSKMREYAREHFGGDEEKAKEFLRTRGYK